jgi:ribosomal protein S18 acetylase RimI-like enzyme
MATIIQATSDHLVAVRDIFWEYLQWANGAVKREFGVTMDSASQLANDMADITKFMPPQGRLLLALDGDMIVGCACLRTQHPHIAELKRMYVRPSARRQGLGRTLVAALIADIQTTGYTILRLDSARFMQQAHALYRSMGFQEVAPYPESEIPPDFHQHWIFMELLLADQAPNTASGLTITE